MMTTSNALKNSYIVVFILLSLLTISCSREKSLKPVTRQKSSSSLGTNVVDQNSNGEITPLSEVNYMKGAFLSPRLRQVAKDTDFSIEVKIDTELFNKYEMQGLTVEQDNDNMLSFGFYSDGSQTRLFAGTYIKAVSKESLNMVVQNGKPIYLKVVRKGSQFSISYSLNGSSFTNAGAINQSLLVTQVGIFANNLGTTPTEFTSLVDYFKADGIEPK